LPNCEKQRAKFCGPVKNEWRTPAYGPRAKFATLVIGMFIITCIIILPQRAGQHPGRFETAS
jgi:hypothetical protein